jgi:hypothetical protein
MKIGEPWGGTYEIRAGKFRGRYEVISYGPDGQADTDDDISSTTARRR